MDGVLTKGVTLYTSSTAATTPDGTPKGNWNWGSKTEVTSTFSYPSILGSRSAIDVTDLSDDTRHYIPGIRENGDRLTFEVYYEGNDTNDNFTKLQTLADGNKHGFCLEIPATHSTNKVLFFFEGIADVVIQGGGVNEAIKLNLEVFLQSDIEEATSFS